MRVLNGIGKRSERNLSFSQLTEFQQVPRNGVDVDCLPEILALPTDPRINDTPGHVWRSNIRTPYSIQVTYIKSFPSLRIDCLAIKK
jgi:hypothetical protein